MWFFFNRTNFGHIENLCLPQKTKNRVSFFCPPGKKKQITATTQCCGKLAIWQIPNSQWTEPPPTITSQNWGRGEGLIKRGRGDHLVTPIFGVCFFLIIIQHTHSKHTVMPVSPDPPRSPPEWFRNIWTLPNFGFETSEITVPIFHKASFILILDNNSWLRIHDYFQSNISGKYLGQFSFQYFLVFYQHFQSFKTILEYFRLQRLPDISSLSGFLSIKGIFISTPHITVVPRIRKSRKNS